ncbi:MAG TPA: glycosyltransferase family 2 protein [Nitrospira sp.]|nr:glycosyltransferase [Nitrospira sp. NTP1]HQR14319.1 glycosyltransferase family 2 protein [Nitrospira sp.]
MVERGDKSKGSELAIGVLVSVVVPVYNEQDGLREFYDRTKRVLLGMAGFEHEIIFVDDGSRDVSVEVIAQLVREDECVRLLKLSRNFGHQIAITAGIDAARGDAVVVIDADLQDPPEVIERFIEKWREGFDVVYGMRETRDGETVLKVWTASIFYRILKSLVSLDIPVDVGDFRLMSRRVVEHLKAMQERDRFVRGLVSWIGFRQIGLLYRREKRYAGETKYPYRKMIRFALDGITSFSNIPLKMATIMGYFTSLVAFAYACSVIVQKFMGYTVQGWATIMVGLLFLGGVQLICLGILGEYVGRIFNETKGRPLYIVDYESSTERLRYEVPGHSVGGSSSKD